MPSTYGEGIAAGINSGMQNLINGIHVGSQSYLGFQRQNLENRRQAILEGHLQSDMNYGTPSASIIGRGAMPTQYVPASAESYATPTLMGEVGPQPKPEQTWNPMGEVGADALVSPKARPGAAGATKDTGELSLEELQELSYRHGQQSKQNALSNANDIDSLKAAYHYDAQMKLAKPYLDQWATALNEVRANPQNPDRWRKVMVLTGEDDPSRALSLATGEYSKLRQQYDQFSSNYAPLNEYLTSRGITPEMYGDEAKLLQFMNQMKFQPHSPRRQASPGASVLGRPPRLSR